MNDGNYKLSWRERISFCAGDLAQNIIYQTVSIWLLFFYTTGRRVAAIVNSIMCLFLKAGMALGGVVPGFVLAIDNKG